MVCHHQQPLTFYAKNDVPFLFGVSPAVTPNIRKVTLSLSFSVVPRIKSLRLLVVRIVALTLNCYHRSSNVVPIYFDAMAFTSAPERLSSMLQP